MKVVLKRDLFLDGAFYSASKNPNIIPDEFANQLPKDAVVVEASTPALKPVDTDNTLRDYDTVRAAETAKDRINKQANAKK